MWLNDITLSHSHLSNPCSNIQLTKLCRFVLWSFIYFLFPTDHLSLTCLFHRKIGDVIYLYSWTEDVSYQTTTTHGFICMVINSSFLWYYIHIPYRSFYQHNFFFIKKRIERMQVHCSMTVTVTGLKMSLNAVFVKCLILINDLYRK